MPNVLPTVSTNERDSFKQNVAIQALSRYMLELDEFVINDAVNDNVTNILTLRHTTTGTPAAGIGASLSFEVETANDNIEIGGVISVLTRSVSSGSEDFAIVFKTMEDGAAAAEIARLYQNTTTSPLNTVVEFPGFAVIKATGAGPVDLQLQASDDLQLQPNFGANSDGSGKLEVSTGLYNYFAATGGNVFLIGSDFSTLTAVPARCLNVEHTSATTNAVVYPLRLITASSGSPANGLGTGMEFMVETAANNYEIGATIEATILDNTSTAEDFAIVFKAMRAGAAAAEFMRAGADTALASYGLSLNSSTINGNAITFGSNLTTGFGFYVDAGAPNVAGTGGGFSAGNSGTGTNLAGGNFNFLAGRGTGNAAGGEMTFYTYTPVASGTGNQTGPTQTLFLTRTSAVIGPGAALATTATDGFLYIPTCAGTPTGTPTGATGKVAMVFDTTNNKLYIYDGGWLGGTAPGAWT